MALSGCGKWYDKDEAVRSLKVLNSDITNMLLTAGELPESKALKFIWDQPTAPVPFPNEKFVSDLPYQPYNLSHVCGIYHWDTISNSFRLISASDSLVINYPDPESGAVSMIIADYFSVPISSKPDFPTKVNSSIWVNGELKTTIQHIASVADELPLNLQTTLTGSNYEIIAWFDRTRNGDNGTISAEMTLIYEKSEVLNFAVNATIGYSAMGYYFNKISFNAKLFRHTVSGKIDYDLIDPTADDYVSSFNSNTRIEIFEQPMKRKVGNIVLAAVNNGELLDYHIQFRNKECVLLSEYLPVINKILQVKL